MAAQCQCAFEVIQSLGTSLYLMLAALQKVRVPALQKMRSYNKDDVDDSET